MLYKHKIIILKKSYYVNILHKYLLFCKVQKRVTPDGVTLFLAPPAGLDTCDIMINMLTLAVPDGAATYAPHLPTAAPCHPRCICHRQRSDAKLPPSLAQSV